MFNTETRNVNGVALATIEHTENNGTDVLSVTIAGRAFSILNLENQVKSNGKAYQRGNLVSGDCSYGTVTVEKSKVTGNPFFQMRIKCPELLQLVGHQDISGTMQNGVANLWERRDDKPQQNNQHPYAPNGAGQFQNDPHASERLAEQSNGA